MLKNFSVHNISVNNAAPFYAIEILLFIRAHILRCRRAELHAHSCTDDGDEGSGHGERCQNQYYNDQCDEDDEDESSDDDDDEDPGLENNRGTVLLRGQNA